MRKFIKISIIVGVVLLGGYAFYQKQAEKNAPEVLVNKAALRDMVFSVSESADVLPFKTVLLSSKIGGRVKRLRVEKGEQVSRHTLLAVIDFPELSQARSALSQAELNVKSALREYKRLEDLYQQGAVSLQQVEHAKTQLSIALTQRREARDTLSNQSSYISIRSPISGTVTEKFVEEGELVMMGAPVFEISDIGILKIEADIDETDIGHVQVGQKVLITMDAYPDKTFHGKVAKIAPKASEMKELGTMAEQKSALQYEVQTRTFKVEIEPVGEYASLLKAGLSADVEIVYKEKKNVLSVPKEALVEENGRFYVFTLASPKVSKKKVKVGMQNTEFAEILEGLSEENAVVVEGVDKLKDGVRVKVIE